MERRNIVESGRKRDQMCLGKMRRQTNFLNKKTAVLFGRKFLSCNKPTANHLCDMHILNQRALAESSYQLHRSQAR